MPTPTYTALANITLGSSASSVTFSSIPATYRDLIFVVSGTVSTANACYLYFNADEADTLYSRVLMYGDGSSALSLSRSDHNILEMGTVQTTAIAQVMDYSATDKHKTSLSRGGPANALTLGQASRWANTAAITTAKIKTSGAFTFQTGTTFALYGIAS
jgi:hypothetical protein